MKNFLIGMYGGFYKNKYKRDFKKEFWGVEACMFPNEEESKLLSKKSKQEGFKFGVHYPLINKNVKLRDCLFLHKDKEIRDKAIEDFEMEVKLAKELGAEYILAHFPKPLIIDRKLDWSFWRVDKSEVIYEDEYPYELLEKYSYKLFEKLSQISKENDIKIVLENDAYNKYFYNTDLLKNLFDKYDNLNLCIDLGRIHYLEKTDKEFDGVKLIEKLLPYIYLIHLWNAKINETVEEYHYPVLPNQSSEEGWADIKKYLKPIAKVNKNIKVLFEHKSQCISDKELDECYNWVRDILKNK